jgi:oxygen-independent coproporphyrinogen-3 oxidase
MRAFEYLWKPTIRRAVTGSWRRFQMTPETPPWPAALDRPGLYLHVPFCKNLCPYCPYNRVRYQEAAFSRYEKAVCQEIDLYAPHLEGNDFTSLYVGGGTPTVDPQGLLRILVHLRDTFAFSGDICVELHPSNMDDTCLEALRRAGATMLSIGVESTNDRLLAAIGRNHDGATAIDSVKRAQRVGFETINADLMFALPGQSLSDWEADLRALLGLEIDQISTYPLFSFPYTELGAEQATRVVNRPPGRLIRSMLRMTDRLASESGLERCAVWSWIRPAKKKFSSITRPHYIGFGPSAASMTGERFYVNTFDVDAYADALPARRPVALSMKVDRRLEMAYWLYWRTYELRASEDDFRGLFGKSLATTYGHLFRPLRLLGMVESQNGGYGITNAGAYWIHRLQNEYSLNYINRLWGCCQRRPWPEGATL